TSRLPAGASPPSFRDEGLERAAGRRAVLDPRNSLGAPRDQHAEDPVKLGPGEVAVIGLARSGQAVTRLLARHGVRVYASDSGAGHSDLTSAVEELGGLGVAVD